MGSSYFNYRTKLCSSRWEKGDFTAAFWRIYARDPRWVPPYFPDLRYELVEERSEHLVRLDPLPVYQEAMRRTEGSQPSTVQSAEQISLLMDPASADSPVAASIALTDPRRPDRASHLALLRSVNDEESLERHLESYQELLRKKGCRRLIGPVGISPYLESGVLQNYWMEIPPLHTASNPPYFPEVIGGLMQPLETSRLYRLSTGAAAPAAGKSPFRLLPADPIRLTQDLLPLFVSTMPETYAGFPPPDELETAYLLRKLLRWPSTCWLAEVSGETVGYVLLQPDLAPVLLRGKGGRRISGRLYIQWAASRPSKNGRLVFGGVHPRWRRRGAASLLLSQALEAAQLQGWRTITSGPLVEGSSGSEFFQALGAEPRQTYCIYHKEL